MNLSQTDLSVWHRPVLSYLRRRDSLQTCGVPSTGRGRFGAVKTRFDQARSIVDELLGKVRRLSFDLRPSDLDQLGLLPALLAFFERFTETTGMLVDFKHKGLDGRFATPVETAAYRIIHEALTNAPSIRRLSVNVQLPGNLTPGSFCYDQAVSYRSYIVTE